MHNLQGRRSVKSQLGVTRSVIELARTHRPDRVINQTYDVINQLVITALSGTSGSAHPALSSGFTFPLPVFHTSGRIGLQRIDPSR